MNKMVSNISGAAKFIWRKLIAICNYLRQHPTLSFVIILYGSIYFGQLFANIYWERSHTPEEKAAYYKAEEIRRKALDQWAIANDREKKDAYQLKRSMCDGKDACSKYPAARDACATAGNYELCLEIKMGQYYYRYRQFCNTNGTYTYTSAPMPSFIDCLTLQEPQYLSR